MAFVQQFGGVFAEGINAMASAQQFVGVIIHEGPDCTGHQHHLRSGAIGGIFAPTMECSPGTD